MKNKIYLMAMLVMVLTLGLLFTGCRNPNGPDPEVDTWAKVANASEMIGTWEGTVTIPIPANEETEPPLPASSISTKLNLTITSSTFTEILTMDMDKYLTDMVGVASKATMWEYITSSLPTETEEYGVTITMEALPGYKLVTTVSIPISMMDFSEENAENAPYINQNKAKLKMVLSAELNSYGEGDMEFILDKK